MADLAPLGALRVAINTGNAVLARRDGDALLGLSVMLARELAEWIGRPLELRGYDSAGATVLGEEAGEWDVAFLAIDPKRAARIHFSRPYLTISASYLTRSSRGIRALSEVDQSEVTIASVEGAAFTLHLRRTLQHATLRTWPTVDEAAAAFMAGSCDVLAGLRPAHEGIATNDPDFRALPDDFLTIEQALATPIGRGRGCDLLDRFVEESISTGLVDELRAVDAVQRHEQQLR